MTYSNLANTEPDGAYVRAGGASRHERSDDVD
jgi:hypothetical protein